MSVVMGLQEVMEQLAAQAELAEQADFVMPVEFWVTTMQVKLMLHTQ
jgi:hypothetical protein